MYELINKESVHKMRSDLLDKYNDGHALTVAELRFLTYTSEELNRSLPNEFYEVYKKGVRILEPKVIQDVRK